jgi:hypothetical protein
MRGSEVAAVQGGRLVYTGRGGVVHVGCLLALALAEIDAPLCAAQRQGMVAVESSTCSFKAAPQSLIMRVWKKKDIDQLTITATITAR